MIKIDFSSAVSVYLSFSIFLVFVVWIFYNRNRDITLNETKYLRQCPYCTYVFFAYVADVIPKPPEVPEKKMDDRPEGTIAQKARVLVCPRCRSYINLEDDPHEQ